MLLLALNSATIHWSCRDWIPNKNLQADGFDFFSDFSARFNHLANPCLSFLPLYSCTFVQFVSVPHHPDTHTHTHTYHALHHWFFSLLVYVFNELPQQRCSVTEPARDCAVMCQCTYQCFLMRIVPASEDRLDHCVVSFLRVRVIICQKESLTTEQRFQSSSWEAKPIAA